MDSHRKGVEGQGREHIHAYRRVHDNVSEVKHGSRRHSDEVAIAIIVDSFNEALQLKNKIKAG